MILRNHLAYFKAIKLAVQNIGQSLNQKSYNSRFRGVVVRPRHFTPHEKFYWHVLQVAFPDSGDDWYELPGSADMWPENFNYEANGWTVPAVSRSGRKRLRRVFKAIYSNRMNEDMPADLIQLLHVRSDEVEDMGKSKGKSKA